jgi:hypothetical protein
MKLYFFALFCLIVFLAADCHKKHEPCHESIYFKNNSSDTIILAERWHNGSLCQLLGDKVNPKTQIDWQWKDCWEEYLLPPNNVLEIYIVDPEKYNPTQIFYSCDSIEIKNKVLKHYFITIDSLLKYNFIVNFP